MQRRVIFSGFYIVCWIEQTFFGVFLRALCLRGPSRVMWGFALGMCPEAYRLKHTAACPHCLSGELPIPGRNSMTLLAISVAISTLSIRESTNRQGFVGRTGIASNIDIYIPDGLRFSLEKKSRAFWLVCEKVQSIISKLISQFFQFSRWIVTIIVIDGNLRHFDFDAHIYELT